MDTLKDTFLYKVQMNHKTGSKFACRFFPAFCLFFFLSFSSLISFSLFPKM